ncbi:hypothetical protein KM043_000989 [Ampulex compressa]|nr:hypothetical protein KM043_000989 [Ampulex compressa]
MNASKRIDVNFSSLVGLKAELLRKQAEVNEAKVKIEALRAVPKAKRRPKKIEEERSEVPSDGFLDAEDVNAHKKSRLALEAKARLYDRLKLSRDNRENFLVDFSRKLEEEVEERVDQKEEEEEEEDQDQECEYPELPEDDWVEYEDCFGRTRKCLREDLRIMREKDELVKRQIMRRKSCEAGRSEVEDQGVPARPKEPEIEIMRRKWEEQTRKLIDKPDIHYQDVLFDEARAHGVAYYAFSQDEKMRSEQQENLARLRKDTEQRQREAKELKYLRDKMEQNRLRAARIRQRVRAGLPIESTQEDPLPADTQSDRPTDHPGTPDVVGKEINAALSKEDVESDRIEKSATAEVDEVKAFGVLLEKKNRWYEMSQAEWVEARRKDRSSEFSPLYGNFKSAGYLDTNDDADDTRLKNDKNVMEIFSPLRVGNPALLDVEKDTTVNKNITLSSTAGSCDVVGTSIHDTFPPAPSGSSTNTERNITRNVTHERCVDRPPKTNDTLLTKDEDGHTVVPPPPNKSIDEDSILAGLRYLREKFEKSHAT